MEILPILTPVIGTFLLFASCMGCGMARLAKRLRVSEERIAILENRATAPVVIHQPSNSVAVPVYYPRPAYQPPQGIPPYYPPVPTAPPGVQSYQNQKSI
jgi:hypothetical protein